MCRGVEFFRIVRLLSYTVEYVRIEVSKEGFRFVLDREAAQVNILLKQTDAAREQYKNYGRDGDNDDNDVVEVEEGDEKRPKNFKEVKKVNQGEDVEDKDEEMVSGDDEAEYHAKSEDEDEPSNSEKKKRKRAAGSSSVRSSLFVPCEWLVTDCTGLKSEKEAKGS
jgi:proliferating cell nuclear antigen